LRLTGSYFELTDRLSGRPTGRATGAAPAERQDLVGQRSDLLISVAKRVVRSAVRRNTVKRIVREAWRSATLDALDRGNQFSTSTPRGTDKGIAEQRTQAGGQHGEGTADRPTGAGAANVAARATSRTCLVRLKRFPGAGAEPAPSLAVIKRSLRKDADGLFAAYLRGSHRR
jgi:hypothetical protein